MRTITYVLLLVMRSLDGGRFHPVHQLLTSYCRFDSLYLHAGWHQQLPLGTVLISQQKYTLEDAIGSHTFAPLEARTHVRPMMTFLSGVHSFYRSALYISS
jgi:hypothetical protein